MDWKKFVSASLPFVPAAKREAVALRDAVFGTGGSQCGEDRWVQSYLEESQIEPHSVRYVEVGANQPSQLSNTWRLYRAGGRGILIEPDPRCTSLLRKWRPRDHTLEAMAGPAGAARLYVHKHTTMNSSSELGALGIGMALCPSVALDDVWRTVGWERCHLLSIDTEGSEEEILRFAPLLLSQTDIVCLEHFGDQGRVRNYQELLGGAFELMHETSLNVIFVQNRSAVPVS